MPEDTKLETAPKKGETAQQFKSRIEETRRELARQEASKPLTPATEVPTPASITPTAAQVNAPGPVAQPQNEPPASATRGTVPEVDEWWAKKGFKTSEDIANSYRELERELTRKNQELARQNAPGAQPPAPPTAPPYGYPSYIPAPNPVAPPSYPAYAPPQHFQPAQVPPPQNVEHLAKQYGLMPEDFEKVYAVANDLSQVNVRRELDRIMPGVLNQVHRVNMEVTRNREMVDLMSEPTWKNQRVQFEMHKILNDDPAILQRQPLPYRYAHDEALKRIARVDLGGSNTFQAPPNNPPASSGGRPPAMAGSNGKGADIAPAGPGTGEISPEQFAALPLKEKREFLQTLGVVGK